MPSFCGTSKNLSLSNITWVSLYAVPHSEIVSLAQLEIGRSFIAEVPIFFSNNVVSCQQERHCTLAIWAWKVCILACSCRNITLCNTCYR